MTGFQGIHPLLPIPISFYMWDLKVKTDPGIRNLKCDILAQTCNPSAEETEASGLSWVQDQPELHNEFQTRLAYHIRYYHKQTSKEKKSKRSKTNKQKTKVESVPLPSAWPHVRDRAKNLSRGHSKGPETGNNPRAFPRLPNLSERASNDHGRL